MDPAPGSATGLLSLSENEQRCYSGLCALCQADSPGTLAAGRVGELLRASQLPPETLHQITEVCGAKRLGYFSTAHFYVALKLLAAAQSGLPVHLESIKSELPLPRFLGMKNDTEVRFPNHSQNPLDSQGPPFGTPPVPIPRAALDRISFRPVENPSDKQEPWSPPRSPQSSPPDSPLSYRTYPYSKQRNGSEPLTASYENKHPGWLGLQESSSPGSYGSRSSLGHSSMPQAHPVPRASEQSAVDYPDDPWRITEEQREYYTNQFRTLQPDLGALILGTVAKNFFTKSKLSIPELSHIWELSDVDCDGALTFPEFCAAFHLIVARKNGYPLPEALPPTLMPSFLEKDMAPQPGGEVFFGSFSESVPLTQQQKDPAPAQKAEPLILFEEAESRPAQPDCRFEEKNKAESMQPTLSEKTTSKPDLRDVSSVSAFSPKRIPAIQDETTERLDRVPEKPDPPQELDHQVKSRTRPRSYSSTSIDDAMKKTEEPPTPPPRPQKTHSRASSLDLNKLFQQSSQGFKGGWLPPPPALPPRPLATQIPHFMPSTESAPKQSPVQQPNFADFSKFREEEENTEDRGPPSKSAVSAEEGSPAKKEGMLAQPPLKPVRRKYRPESQNLDSSDPSAPLTSTSSGPGTRTSQKQASRQKKDIQTAIRKNKEANAVLTRLNSELQQQLKEVHQERISLESQLDVLRPIAFV